MPSSAIAANAAATCSGEALMPWPNEMLAIWMSDHFSGGASRPAVAPGSCTPGRSPKWNLRTHFDSVCLPRRSAILVVQMFDDAASTSLTVNHSAACASWITLRGVYFQRPFSQ